MKSAILELNQNKKVAGRTNIKWIILEMHNSITEYNRNGITWMEKYISRNIDSAKGMPICVEFMNEYEKSEPYGHGMSEVKDGNPLFEYSTVVGVTENAYIDSLEINGEQKKVLIGEGYIYNQRYPKFVQWLKSKMFDGEFPETSVEICAKDGNDLIVYESGWKEKGRVPMEFDFSGDAILGVEPADPSAILLELNNKINKNKEEELMSEQNAQLITELNEKIETKTNEINELKNQVKELTSQKEIEVNELNSKIEEITSHLESKENELNSLVEEIKDIKELNSKLESDKTSFETELNELRAFKQETVNKELIAEFNNKLTTYTDSEKDVAKEKIEKFNSEPSKELMNEIISEINSTIAKDIIEKRTKAKSNEQNNNQADDIYSDVIEINSGDTSTIEDLY